MNLNRYYGVPVNACRSGPVRTGSVNCRGAVYLDTGGQSGSIVDVDPPGGSYNTGLDERHITKAGDTH